MKNRSLRIAVTALVAALSVFGLSQSPASAKVAHHSVAKTNGSWCC
jgi:tetrahydromethanopterin S-methyltransferase subunit D